MLEINVREDKKIVEVWLTNADQEDPNVAARLDLLYAKYRNTDYMVSVFKSGKRDLYLSTLDLCLENRMKATAAR